jgi:predicted alpha/beta-hydrolase family hydrolase
VTPVRHQRRRFAVGTDDAVSGVIAMPAGSAAAPAVVLAHGAGKDMETPLLVAFADRLAAAGFPTVRFNFPYTEHRRRAPDPAPRLEAAYRAVLAALRSDPALRERRVVIGGKSMGGRMASHLAAAGERVDGLLFLGYPLHPAGRPERIRAAHLRRIDVPMLFLAGTRDPLARLDLLRESLRGIDGATLHVVEDGDHSFAVRKRSGRDPAAVLDELVAASTDWLGRIR